MVSVAPRSGEDWLRLGEAVRDRRVELGMTQDDLADEAGIATGTVRNLEKGNRVRDLMLPKINRALGWDEGSYKRVLDEGLPPTVAELVAEPDDSLRLPRPADVSPQAWAEITEKLMEDLAYYLRHER